MQPPLNDDIFKRKGISLLWDANVLAGFCDAKKILSLRSFLLYHKNNWKGIEREMSKTGALVVAGLESCVDSLSAKEAEEFLSKFIYKAIISFQDVVMGGGVKSALILWVGNKNRMEYTVSGKLYLSGFIRSQNQKIALGQCLFQGTENEIREIEYLRNKEKISIGYFQDRIS